MKLPVLLVEDDAATAELERRVLARSGRTVRTTDRAEEAVAILRREPVLVVILDYRLKDGQAWPVLEAAQDARPRVPVIVVTAMGDERIAAEAVHRGAADYLIKTGDFSEQLPPVVDRAVRLAEAEHANARLAALVEHSRDAILAASPDGRILSWNQGARQLFGLEEADVLGQPLERLLADGQAPVLAALAERARRGEEIAAFEAAGRTRDGRRLDLSVTLSAVRDRDRRVSGLSFVARDVTDLKRMQQELVRTQSLAAVGEMAATVAHEVRNPLAAISGPLQILSRDLPSGDSRKGLMDEILHQVKRLDGTVRGLLALSKPATPRKQPVPLRELVERIVRMMADHEQGRRARFTVQGGERLILPADPDLLEQLLWNLFLNAAEAGKEGGAVDVALRGAAHEVELTVVDGGAGIPPELLPRIFRPFVTTKASGTGLGLPLCRKIVDAHAGTIEVESQVGRGTTVRVRLPV